MTGRLALLLPTLFRLGAGPVLDVLLYRLACRTGLYRVILPVKNWEEADAFFPRQTLAAPELPAAAVESILARAERALTGELDFYSSATACVGAPPDWFLDPFGGSRLPAQRHWSALNEFAAGDIKNVWEISRFEWVPLLARAWRLSCDGRYLEALNAWLCDFAKRNPVNAGPNWKCGQEAGIRVINLLLGARLAGCHREPSASLMRLVAWHCDRILPTIRYAVAQDNNHGTSEAAALFIAGAWLSGHGDGELREKGERWQLAGRRWLENRVYRLVARDGSFSQYSVNYHRVLMDTLCQVELWRRESDAPPFSDGYLSRCRAATAWLLALADPETGEGPNLGANDGARLYDLAGAAYADLRPTLQLCGALFNGRRFFAAGAHDAALLWLDLEAGEPAGTVPLPVEEFPDGGYLVLRRGGARAVIRLARYRFRPGHSDCLHLDLWHRGVNVLRDGGTYSYNNDARWLEYFGGTESHNTVQFDGRSQMPRLGRFLYGAWLRMQECAPVLREGETLSWSGSYRDWLGGWQRRTITAAEGGRWLVRDEIGGFSEKAVLRWRLAPGTWSLEGDTCRGDGVALRVKASSAVRRLELARGWESHHYQQKTELPVLEIEVGPGLCTLETEIRLKE